MPNFIKIIPYLLIFKFREHKSLAKWNRQKKEEINDSIGSILKQEYFNQTSPNKQMDLFVPHRTEANFKPKPKTNTLSSIKSSRPPRKERVLTSLRFPENKEVEVKIHGKLMLDFGTYINRYSSTIW